MMIASEPGCNCSDLIAAGVDVKITWLPQSVQNINCLVSLKAAAGKQLMSPVIEYMNHLDMHVIDPVENPYRALLP